jgi:hypothetical protein
MVLKTFNQKNKIVTRESNTSEFTPYPLISSFPSANATKWYIFYLLQNDYTSGINLK